jgi:hypothetical protein
MAFKRLGDIMKGNPSKAGARRTTTGGATYTWAPTKDPKIPGGTFLSVRGKDGKKRTAVFDSKGKRSK